MKAWELAATVVAGIGQLVGVRAGTEQPKYSVVETRGGVELRHYGPRLAAEATVRGDAEAARNAGFRKVAGYIFGGNTGKASIAMTAPVVQSGSGKGQSIAMTAPVVQTTTEDQAWRIQFVMPARYSRDTLPTPTDPSVRIVELPAQDYAVLRFSGSRSAQAVERKTAELHAAVTANGWRAEGAPVAWFYDPPWTPPFFRRNEVATVVRQVR